MQRDELIWQNINKDKKNPGSGFVAGIIEIGANTTLQMLVCASFSNFWCRAADADGLLYRVRG